MSIPAYNANILGTCKYLMKHGHTSPAEANDLMNIPQRFVDRIMKRIMLKEGLIQECGDGYYLKVDRFHEWRQDYEGSSFWEW